MSSALKTFKLRCLKSELRLDFTLQCGQSFRWREVSPGSWRGVIGNNVWTLSQDDLHLFCQIHDSSVPQNIENGLGKEPKRKRLAERRSSNENQEHSEVTNVLSSCRNADKLDHVNQEKAEAILRDYFQLDIPLKYLYEVWSKADKNFAGVSARFPGVRILNQDPVENVFSFICSSNNNIQRISQLVERLCQLYGTPLATVDDVTWHSFPCISSLASQGVEDTLRQHGFGYRAKFIQTSAHTIMAEGGETWLNSLRSLPYQECHTQLMRLSGVGAKVSDCICLMSLGHLSAIPVDTHVFQIAARDYLPHLQGCKSLTPKVYSQVADHFRNLFGEFAGWAHSVLFTADLKKFDSLKSDVNKVNKKKKTRKLCT